MFRRAVPWAFLVLVCAAGGKHAWAAHPAGRELSAADLLPPTTALYAEVPQPGKLLDLAMDHPIHQRLREMDDYQKAFQTPQYQQFLVAVKVLEGAVEMRWRPALKLLTEGGVYAAVDRQTQGVALLVQSADGEKLAALRDALFTFVRADAQQKGRGDPVKTREYRGLTAHAAGQARFAIFGDWLIVTNKDELGKAVLDRYLDAEESTNSDPGAPASLAERPRFQEAQKTRPVGAVAWGYADVQGLREAGVANKVFEGPKDNPLAELLLGGVIALANHAPFATAALEADEKRLALSTSLPFRAEWVDESRVYYFGPQGQGTAPPLASVDQTVFSLSTYRDLGEFWASAPDLFNDDINAKFADANNGLTTLFSGRDFGDEVLGAAQPGLQLVVARQQFPQAELPAPNIKLPAFAGVFRLRDAASMRRPLKVTFQSLIGFLNVVGAMQGQPPLELSNEQRDGAEIVSSKYLPPADPEDAKRGRINYNFAPTAVFVGDKLIVSSTQALAVELAESAEAEGQGEPPTEVNTQAKFNAGVLRAILEDNREQLIAQNMLEEGHSREEAEKEIGALLTVLGWIGESAVRLTHDDQTLRLEWSVAFAPPQEQEK